MSLPSLQGYLGTPGPADGGRSYNHSPGMGAVAPWSLHTRLLEVTCERTIQAFWEVTPHCLQLFLLCGCSFVWCLVGLELPPARGTLPAWLAPDCPCDATIRPTVPQPFPAL